MIVCPGFIKTNLQTRALGSDGNIASHAQTTVGKSDTPDNVAKQIVNGVIRRKPILVLTLIGKISYHISRFFPQLYERIMTRQLKDEL